MEAACQLTQWLEYHIPYLLKSPAAALDVGIISAMDDFINLVQTGLNIDLTADQIQLFEDYEKLLVEWNQKFNLTAIADPEGIHLKHFYDSLTCQRVIQDISAAIIDVGCGAGFPGIPLKILRPDFRLTLVESVGKKTDFCSEVVKQLGLKDVAVLHARVEDLGQDRNHREKYDWAVARALAPMPVLAEYLLPLVRVGGSVLAQKGSSAGLELQQAAGAIALLGGEVVQVDEFELPVLKEKRVLIKIGKRKATPLKFPRKAGLPSKKPLI
jgi:16S rRNA (guanine(527)-N(7))-methyltransferase GidB